MKTVRYKQKIINVSINIANAVANPDISAITLVRIFSKFEEEEIEFILETCFYASLKEHSPFCTSYY